MNSLDHAQRRLDAAFVLELERDGHRYAVRPELSFACTLKMVQMMKVITLHTFNTREDVDHEFAAICETMRVRTPHKVVQTDGRIVVVCGGRNSLRGVTREMCDDLCEWGKLHRNAHSLTRHVPQHGKAIGEAVRALEDVCAQVAREHAADYVLVNVLYENHYSSIASYPKNIDGLWRCHSVCHTVDGEAHKRVSLRDHPFELGHAPDMHYSGLILRHDPTVAMCCLTARAVDLCAVIGVRAAAVRRELERLDEKGLLAYEYWMWRYVRRNELRGEKRCCAIL